MSRKEEMPFDMVQRFRDICEMEEITPYQVWKETDIPQSTFYTFMKEGNKEISFLNLVKICKVFRISPSTFCCRLLCSPRSKHLSRLVF